MFARQLALQISLGRSEFIGMPLNTKHRRALYVTTEDSIEDTRFVFDRQFKCLARESERRSCDLHILFADRLTSEELLESLGRSLRTHPADLVVIDSFGDVFNGRDGNSNMEVRKALKPFSALAQSAECLMLFVTHINKSAYDAAPQQAHVQGAAALVQKLRVVLDMRCDPHSTHRYLSITKGNAISSTVKSFAMKLDFDEEGFVYSDTGHRIPVDEVGTYQPEARRVVDWPAIFAGATELRASELVDRLKEDQGIMERSARNLIYKHLTRVSQGIYCIPGNHSSPEEVEEVEEDVFI